MDIPRQLDATAHSKPEYASKELCCRFRFATAISGKFGCNNHSRSPVNLGVIIIPGRHRSAVQSFPSKLYFCGHKTPFRTHKSNLPNAGASERIAAVSHGERWSGKPNHQCIQV